MVDAGSAGTRAHIFTWIKNNSDPIIKPFPDWNRGIVIKSNIPLSAAANDETAIFNIFNPVINKASKAIPAKFIPQTKMYIYATAGLRVLPTSKQAEILENTYNFLFNNSPFKILKSNVRIMSGSEEAIYGWISVKYLTGFDSNAQKNSLVGSIDMGGASVQIAFETYQRKNVHRIVMNNKKYVIFAISMLGLGVNEAMKKILYVNMNPCFPDGYLNDNPFIKGLGSFENCVDLVRKLNIPKEISNETINIPRFYGMASFYYTNEFFNLTQDSTATELKFSTKQFCETTWKDLNEKYKNNHFLKNYCFFGSFQYDFIEDGFGFNFTQSTIIKAGYINGAELSWAIGAMIKEVNLAKIDPYFIPSKIPLLLMNLFFLCKFLFQYLYHIKKSKKSSFFSRHSSKLLLQEKSTFLQI